MQKDPPPELVMEIDITNRSIDREPIYAARGVPEIWRYDGQRIECLQLYNGVYRLREFSLVFPYLASAKLKKFLDLTRTKGETAAIRAFVIWVRGNQWAPSAE